jgi:hypothetical protein
MLDAVIAVITNGEKVLFIQRAQHIRGVPGMKELGSASRQFQLTRSDARGYFGVDESEFLKGRQRLL